MRIALNAFAAVRETAGDSNTKFERPLTTPALSSRRVFMPLQIIRNLAAVAMCCKPSKALVKKSHEILQVSCLPAFSVECTYVTGISTTYIRHLHVRMTAM